MIQKLRKVFAGLSGLPLADAPRRPGQQEIRRHRSPGIVFTANRPGQQVEFEDPPFDLSEISAAIATDSFLRQAVNKYVDLIFKEGWHITSKRDEAREYIRQRLAFIAEQTGVPTQQFLWEIGEDLVKYHNVFIAKVRSDDVLVPQGYRIQGLNGKKPVAGYFLLPPPTLRIARRPNGEVVRYEQVVGQETRVFRADEIIHIAHRRERGHAFGTPDLLTVLDDVRILREIEHNVSRLFYLHLYPLYLLLVGGSEPGQEATPEEIELARQMLQNIELGGILAMPADRYKLEIKGAEGSALNAEWALRYFERRVLSGVSVPETAFGRGDAVNRATADQLTAEMHDRVKALQRVISLYVEEFIFKELLMEAGFDPILDPDSHVYLEFSDIRTDEIIKKENHEIFKYEHNVITFDELRRNIGLDPLTDEEKRGLFLYQVTIPRILAQQAARRGEESTGSPDTDNRNKPRNQHGVKAAPKSRLKVAAHEETGKAPGAGEPWREAMAKAHRDIVESVRAEKTGDLGLIGKLLHERLRQAAYPLIVDGTLSGLDQLRADRGITRRPEVRISLLLRQAEGYFDRHAAALIQDWIDEASLVDKEDLEALEELKRRAMSRAQASIWMAREKARWHAYAVGARALGEKALSVRPSEGSCEKCAGQTSRQLALKEGMLEEVPPFHPGCRCELALFGEDPQ